MKQILGLDLGKARTGVALSDELRMLAHPLGDDREQFGGDGGAADSEDRGGTERGLRRRRIAATK